jgi:hypothetical protein
MATGSVKVLYFFIQISSVLVVTCGANQILGAVNSLLIVDVWKIGFGQGEMCVIEGLIRRGGDCPGC